jgi:hypothetical protein
MPRSASGCAARAARAGAFSGTWNQKQLPLPGAQLHLAVARELDRVADEVDEHLAQPMRIAAHSRPDVRHRERPQLDVVAERSLGQQVDDVAHDLGQVEVRLRERELAGLDPRQAQDVVDQELLALAGAQDGVDQLLLAFVEPGVAQQVRGADDTVHRRPDLVAHVREEGGLGAVGDLGDVDRRPQLLRADLHRALERVAIGIRLVVRPVDAAQHVLPRGEVARWHVLGTAGAAQLASQQAMQVLGHVRAPPRRAW